MKKPLPSTLSERHLPPSWWRDFEYGFLFVFVLFAYGILIRDPNTVPIRTLSLIFSSIILEAMPFMLVGSLVGGLIEVFMSRERMAALLPRRTILTPILAAGMGLLFPVCECAVVPVVRRLARKGLPASAAIAYLLGGPIVNPIVAASTALAYNFDGTVVALRMGFGFALAVLIACVMGWAFRKEPILREDLLALPRGAEDHPSPGSQGEALHSECACGCRHGHAPEGHPHPAHDPRQEDAAISFGTKILFAFHHAADDFVSVGPFLVIGAFIAALSQTYIDRKIFLGMSQLPVLPSVAMMGLAILLNLCSEADAFIAASFRGLMPFPSQMAFMLIGPMFDLKLLLMYRTVFRNRAIVALAVLILTACFNAALILEMFYRGKGIP